MRNFVPVIYYNGTQIAVNSGKGYLTGPVLKMTINIL